MLKFKPTEKSLKYVYNEITSFREKIFRPSQVTKLMICGSSLIQEKSIRKLLSDSFSIPFLLSDIERYFLYLFNIEIIYPEQIFNENIFGRSDIKPNLLELENFLAESADVIIIVLESAGAIAELGAFSNHKKLNKKIIALIDEKYKLDKSFIMFGPVKLLKQNKLNQVVFYDFEFIKKSEKIPNELLIKIDKSIQKIIKYNKSKLKRKRISASEKIEYSLITLLYMFENIQLSTIKNILMEIEKVETQKIDFILHLLTDNKKYITKRGNLYNINHIGVKYLISKCISNTQINNLRVKVLNHIYRGKLITN